VPAFYDSIELARDRAFAKFHRRRATRNPVSAFFMTFVEGILALLMVRGLYRVVRARL
jgi:hydrophobic/amphiphilic exporter-1 (mainly G- bacteria), HAE1 family